MEPMASDVTTSELHYLEEEFSRRLLRDASIFDFLRKGALDGMWYRDLESPDHLWIDDKFWATLGYNSATKAHLSCEWEALIDPEDLQVLMDNFNRHIAEPTATIDQVVRYRHRNGSIKWMRCRAVALVDERGNPTRMLCVHSDVTALKLTEQHLMEQSRNLQGLSKLALDAAPNAMLMVDEKGSILLSNQAAVKLFGYSREELSANTVDLLVPKHIKASHPNMLSSFFRAPESRAMGSGRVLYGQHKNNSMIPLEIGLNPITNQEQKLVIASIVDISERRKLEQRFEMAIEAAPNAMFMVDDEGEILLLNKATEQMFGYRREELTGQNVNVLLPESLKQRHPQLLASFITAPKKRAMGAGRDLLGVRKDGTELPLEIALNPITEDGKTLVMVAVIDISVRKEHERKIAKYTLELERSNKELDSFAYVASHDIKAPLRGIAKLGQWIYQDLECKLDRQTEKYFDLLFNRINRLENLLDDLLSYSRLRHNTNEALEPVDVGELCAELFALCEAPQQFKLICEANLPRFSTLRTPFNIVLRNLIGNAIKHRASESGRITVSAQEKGDFYAFSVCDDGEPIAEKYHQSIFEIFQTLKPRDEVEGSGIGLTVVRKTLNQFHCQIELKSGETTGNCFTFTWPNEVKFKELLK